MAQRLGGGPFAWHPLRVESVAWVAERKDVLSAFFFLLALVFYSSDVVLHAAAWKKFLVIVAFLWGLLAKPMIVTMPLVLLLWDYWPLQRRERIGRLILEKLPLIALSVASCIVTLIAQRNGGAVHPMKSSADLIQRVFLALCAIVTYVLKEIRPADLGVLYRFKTVSLLAAAPAAGVVLVITVTVVLLRRRSPQLFVGWIWFVVMLTPVIGIVRVGEQWMADRYMYLPGIGLVIIAAWTLARWARNSRPIATLFSVALLFAYATATASQVAAWYDARTLFTATLAATGYYPVDGPEILQGRYEEAVRDYFAAPGGPAAGWTAGGSANDFFRTLTPRQRIEYCQIDADQIPGPAAPHIELGDALMEEEDYADAAVEFDIVVQISPGDPAAQLRLAKSQQHLRHFAAALEHARRAANLDPRDIEARDVAVECEKELAQSH